MTLYLDENERANYRKSTEGMQGITLTPRREKCYACGKWRNFKSGTVSAHGFLCHSCGRGAK